MSATNAFEQTVLEAYFTNVADNEVGLFTAAPGEAGGGTEVSGGSYARVVASFGAYSGGAVANDAAVDFGAATADWGTVTHFGVFTTAGVLIAYGTLDASKNITNGDSAEFPIGTLIVTMD